MQPEGFDQHGVSQLLRDQGASGSPITHFAQHSLDCPAQRLSLQLVLQRHNGRQHIQQKAGVCMDWELGLHLGPTAEVTIQFV